MRHSGPLHLEETHSIIASYRDIYTVATREHTVVLCVRSLDAKPLMAFNFIILRLCAARTLAHTIGALFIDINPQQRLGSYVYSITRLDRSDLSFTFSTVNPTGENGAYRRTPE